MQRDVGQRSSMTRRLDALRAEMQGMSQGLSSWPSQSPKVIAANPWIVSSLLQKSIRRGERQIAQRAAITLVNMRGAAIWRRLVVIAFEDVGVGSIDALTSTVAAASDATWRRACGGDICVAAFIADMLADKAKDRSADYLGVANEHPGLSDFAAAIASETVEAQLSVVQDPARSLPQRAIAALIASGFGSRADASRKRDLDALLALYGELGAPDELIAATATAALRTREPITALVPLIWLAVGPGERLVESPCSLPQSPVIGGVPLYAFDKHTRLGKQAIRELVRSDAAVRSCLRDSVPEPRWQAAVEIAAFYADAAPIAKRLDWAQSRSLEALGKEADFATVGVPLRAIEPLQAAMAGSLERLNEIRKTLWLKASAAGGASR
jgi:hypothetical protein